VNFEVQKFSIVNINDKQKEFKHRYRLCMLVLHKLLKFILFSFKYINEYF